MSSKQMDVHILNTEIESAACKVLALSAEIKLTIYQNFFKNIYPTKNAYSKIFPFC